MSSARSTPPRRPVVRRPRLLSALALLLTACGGGGGDGDDPPGGTAPTTRVLTVSPAGPAGAGTVRVGSASCALGATCPSEHATGSSVTITAEPAAGFTVASWGGSCAATSGTTCTVTMSEARTVSVTFAAAALQALAVTPTGTTGRVTSTPSGIDCTVAFDVAAGTCSASFPAGTEVRLAQAPVSSSTFVGWTGGCTGAAASCTVVAGAAPTVGARWLRGTAGEIRLSLNGDGVGRITSDPAGLDCEQLDDGRERGTCEANFRPGTAVRLIATPTGGSWSAARPWGNACTGASCVITSGPGSQLATGGFDRSHFPVTITLADGAGAALRLTAPQVPDWTCDIGVRPDGSPVGTTCTLMHPRGGSGSIGGSTVPGLPVAGWRRYAGCGDPCSLGQLTGPRALVLAVFRTTPALLTTGRTSGSTGAGRVTLATGGASPSSSDCLLGDDNTLTGLCFAARAETMTVTLSATPVGGARFEGWSSAACGATPTCTVTVPAPGVTTVTARFMRP